MPEELVDRSNTYGYVIIGIVFFIIIILLIVSIILFGKNGPNNANAQLVINGLTFNLINDTTVNAQWVSVADSGDEAILYADTVPINLDPNGQPSQNPNILSSQKINANANKSVAISNLKPNTKYYLTLVVTNPNVTGMNPEPGTIYTGKISASTQRFIIQNFNTPGAISLDTSNNTTITYQTNINKTGINDVFNYDINTQTISTLGVGKFSQTRPTLYNNSGKLAAANLASLQSHNNFSSVAQWIYTTDNKWCLANDNSNCMSLGSDGNIDIIKNTNNQWINLPVLQTF